MQALIKKNKNFRRQFFNSEINQYIFSALKKNKLLVNNDKTIFKNLWASDSHNQVSLTPITTSAPKFEKKGRDKKVINTKGGISKVRNICVMTGRTRALVQDYKISRLKFKELAEIGYLPGVKKL